MIQIKRAYDRPSKTDGFRLLVDRLWPRGISREEAKIDLWLKEVSPEPGLRKWFGHDPKKFPEFAKRYKASLKEKQYVLDRIKDIEKEHGTVTLLFGAKDTQHNNAIVLLQVLNQR